MARWARPSLYDYLPRMAAPNFLDDPRDLIAELDAAWGRLGPTRGELLDERMQTAAEWRLASGKMMRRHPLDSQVEPDEFGRWRVSKAGWLPESEAKTREDGGERDLAYGCDQVWHAFDADGRITLVRNPYHTDIAVHTETGDGGSRTEILTLMNQAVVGVDDDERIVRIDRDGSGRLVQTASRSVQQGTRYTRVERFEYGDDGRCVRSVSQAFEIISEVPHYLQDKTPQELRSKYYRSLDGGEEIVGVPVEYLPRRRWFEYEYDESGGLIRVAAFDGPDGQEREELPFERQPTRPLPEVVDDYVTAMAKQVIKAAKTKHPGQPFAGLALIYSCEHPHCGLPHAIGVCPAGSPPADPLDWEAYPERLGIEMKRPLLKTFGALQDALDRAFAHCDEFDEQNAAVVDLMRRIAAGARDGLGKRQLAPDAAVAFIDDHGDVEAEVVAESPA